MTENTSCHYSWDIINPILKVHDWFKSDGDIVGFGGFCLVAEFHLGGSAANRATLNSSMRRCSWIVESVIFAV